MARFVDRISAKTGYLVREWQIPIVELASYLPAIDVLSRFHHPCLLWQIDIHQSTDKLGLDLPIGSLILDRQLITLIPNRQTIAEQLLSGLVFLHDHKISLNLEDLEDPWNAVVLTEGGWPYWIIDHRVTLNNSSADITVFKQLNDNLVEPANLMGSVSQSIGGHSPDPSTRDGVKTIATIIQDLDAIPARVMLNIYELFFRMMVVQEAPFDLAKVRLISIGCIKLGLLLNGLPVKPSYADEFRKLLPTYQDDDQMVSEIIVALEGILGTNNYWSTCKSAADVGRIFYEIIMSHDLSKYWVDRPQEIGDYHGFQDSGIVVKEIYMMK